MAFFLAGLQTMDKEQLEAARVDGAGNWVLLRDHVMPHLRPVFSVVVVLGVIGNLQHFDTIYALTGGGPVRATTVLSVEVYRRAFEQLGHRPRLGHRRALGRDHPAARLFLSAPAAEGRPDHVRPASPPRTRRLPAALASSASSCSSRSTGWSISALKPNGELYRIIPTPLPHEFTLHALHHGADDGQSADAAEEQPDRLHSERGAEHDAGGLCRPTASPSIATAGGAGDALHPLGADVPVRAAADQHLSHAVEPSGLSTRGRPDPVLHRVLAAGLDLHALLLLRAGAGRVDRRRARGRRERPAHPPHHRAADLDSGAGDGVPLRVHVVVERPSLLA